MQILNNNNNDSFIFIKIDNITNGQYFTELTKLVLSRHGAPKGHNNAVEMRVSTCGMEFNEGDKLSK